MAGMKRAIGYCENDQCVDRFTKVFLVGIKEINRNTRCGLCGTAVTIALETAYTRGDKDFFTEVRIEHNYDCSLKRYRDVAVLQDTSAQEPGNTYVVESPLIYSPNHGLRVAESILSALNHSPEAQEDIPRNQQVILSFDDPRPKFQSQLADLQKVWASSKLSS